MGIFRRMKWDVSTASTVGEGLRALHASSPDWIILDLMLPDGEGITVLREIRARGLQVRVAVTTGMDDARHLAEVASLRPDVIFRKPVDFQELLGTLGSNLGD